MLHTKVPRRANIPPEVEGLLWRLWVLTPTATWEGSTMTATPSDSTWHRALHQRVARLGGEGGASTVWSGCQRLGLVAWANELTSMRKIMAQIVHGFEDDLHANAKPMGVAVSHCMTWFQTRPILTTCQIRYHGHRGVTVALDSSEP